MEIAISSRGIDLSEGLVAATNQKIGKLARFLDMDLASVHYAEERNPRIAEMEICEVVIEGHGQQVQCKVAAIDGLAALDLAVEKLEPQLARLKTKQGARHKRP
ncbi:MAG: ribosome hibernation-promoting factor, HPF/YfiA family [Acidimicrobiales bacterium]